MKFRYTLMCAASNVGSAVLGYIAGKKTYDVTGSAVCGVAVGATVNCTVNTTAGKVIGKMAANDVVKSFNENCEG